MNTLPLLAIQDRINEAAFRESLLLRDLREVRAEVVRLRVNLAAAEHEVARLTDRLYDLGEDPDA